MKLRELLQQMQDVQKKIGSSPAYICGGTPRDRFLNQVEKISDVDVTTGDKTVQFLAQELTSSLGKHYNIINKNFDDGHSSLHIGNFKMDFSSNFNVENIEAILVKMGIKNPTEMQKEMFSRDFTCNALLLSLDLRVLLDPTKNGLKDMKEKKIKTCLDPSITLTTNRNRVIRAVYLSSKLGFDIDESIIDFVQKNPGSVKISTPSSLAEKLNAAFKMDADRAAHNITKMGIWGEIPITDIVKPYYLKSGILTSKKASQTWKDYLVTWTDIYSNQRTVHVKMQKPTEDHAIHAIPNRGDIFKKLDKFEEAILQNGQWIPKPDPYANSKIPVIIGNNPDFLEYASSTLLEYTSEIAPEFEYQGELDFETAYNIAISMLKDRPKVVLNQDSGGNWWVGELDPVVKKAYFQGGGGVNQPTPKKKKYKSDTAIVVQPRFEEPFYRNYDLYDTPGKHSPGAGWHSMEKYKSISEFLEVKRKKMKDKYKADDSWIQDSGEITKKNPIKARALLLEKILIKTARMPGMGLFHSLQRKFGPINRCGFCGESKIDVTFNCEHCGKGGPVVGSQDDNDIDFPIDEQIESTIDHDGDLSNHSTEIGMGMPSPTYDSEDRPPSDLDYGHPESENSILVDEDLIDLLTEKYLDHEARTQMNGLPDGFDHSEEEDASVTEMNTEYGTLGPESTIYEDKWNI